MGISRIDVVTALSGSFILLSGGGRMKNKSQLDNGVIFITDENLNLHTISISLFFKAGTYYENDSNYGISHLVEHLFFRQLHNLSQRELYNRMESIGTTLRGRTYRDFVCFDIVVVPEFYYQAMELISKILEPFTWTGEQIEKEKAVVKKQIESKYETYDEYVEKRYFKQKVYEIPVMGYVEIINSLSVEQVNQWKSDFFHCNNACLTICGAVTPDMVEQTVYIFQQIKNSGPEAITPIVKPKNFVNRLNPGIHIIPWDDTVADVWITFDTEESNFYKLQIISSMLAEGVGSRLSYLLTDVYALTDLISSRVDLYNGFSKLIIEYSVTNKDIIQSLEILFRELIKFKNEITDTDYLTSIPFFTSNLRKRLDRPEELSFDYGWFEFILNREYAIDDRTINNNQKISIAELQETVKTLFSPNNIDISVRNNAKILRRHILKDYLEGIVKRMN